MIASINVSPIYQSAEHQNAVSKIFQEFTFKELERLHDVGIVNVGSDTFWHHLSRLVLFEFADQLDGYYFSEDFLKRNFNIIQWDIYKHVININDLSDEFIAELTLKGIV